MPRKLQRSRSDRGRPRKVEEIHDDHGRRVERQRIYDELRREKIDPKLGRALLLALKDAREERAIDLEKEKIQALRDYEARILAMEALYRDHGFPRALPAPSTDTTQ